MSARTCSRGARTKPTLRLYNHERQITKSMTRLLTDLIGATPLFSSLDHADREAIAARMRPVQFDANQTIFERGETGRSTYLVIKGRVRLSILTSDGRELSLVHAIPGGIFGEIAALDGRERTATATAITRVEAMALSQSSFLEIVASNPKVARATILFLCSRLRDTDERFEAIALHRIEVRLSRLLLSTIRTTGSRHNTNSVPLDLGMSQSELALLVGASRSKVNRALMLLEDLGAIRRSGSTIVCDIATLNDIADAGGTI